MLRDEVESFQETYADKIREVIAGLNEIVSVYLEEGKKVSVNGLITFIQAGQGDWVFTHTLFLETQLQLLIKAVDVTTPKAISWSTEHDTAYYNGSSFIIWVEDKFLDNFKKEVMEVSKRSGSNFNELTAPEQKIVKAYAILTEELLPAWKRDNYLQKLGEALEAEVERLASAKEEQDRATTQERERVEEGSFRKLVSDSRGGETSQLTLGSELLR